ncbi:PAS domain-containing protein [Pseudoxanthomonas sp. NC8]|nr:PAS domain-containing protein [Pseudoxanthomonas sp. NC8]
MLLVAVVSTVVFWLPYPLLFLAYPPLLLAAFRHGFAGVAVSILLVGTIGSIATAMGHGAIVQVDGFGGGGRVAILQLYIAGACLMTIPVALVMNERGRLTARLRDSEQRFRMLADYSHDVIVRMSADGVRLYVSPSARDLLGWSPEEMLGTRWDMLHPDDRAMQQQAMDMVLASGQAHTDVYRMLHKDGHYVWIEAVTRPIPSIDGQGHGHHLQRPRRYRPGGGRSGAGGEPPRPGTAGAGGCADRAGQPQAVRGRPRPRAAAAQAPRNAGRAGVPGHRPLQAHQRRPWPRGRRPCAVHVRAAAGGQRSRHRPGGEAGWRRIRDPHRGCPVA